MNTDTGNLLANLIAFNDSIIIEFISEVAEIQAKHTSNQIVIWGTCIIILIILSRLYK